MSIFARPDLVLVSLQYLMIQCSTLFLLFTLFYFLQVGRVTQAVLCCLIFNPLFLHLGNMISSDGLFLALSMTWFALLLWIIYKPSNKIIGWHVLLLFAAFTVRYNALLYPIIALAAFGLSKLSLRKKLAGLGCGLLLIVWFIGLTLFQYKKFTGFWQFSPFSGWQLANNAIYAYREVDSADLKPVPLKFHALDNMVRNFHTIHPNLQVSEVGSAYMWLAEYPLMQYHESLFKKDTANTQFKKWASMGPLYSSYGWYIIKKYPVHFLRYFIWPNTGKYLAPPVEYLEYYNSESPTVSKFAWQWFGYSNNEVKTRMKNGKVWVLQQYPFLVSVTNLLLLLGLLSYILLKGRQYNKTFNKSILLTGLFWIANAGFTIFASPAALRFQAFPALLSAIFSLLLIDWMSRLTQHLKHQNQPQHLNREYSQKVSA
ncbi:MAG TPA: hypothetical protein VIM79_22600 [Niastella sp.]